MATTDFTIADVLEWARTKPAGERYNYFNLDGCALAQFVVSQGLKLHGSVRDSLESGVVGGTAFQYPHTFGAFADRLALLPETPVTKSDWARLDAYMADIELASA